MIHDVTVIIIGLAYKARERQASKLPRNNKVPLVNILSALAASTLSDGSRHVTGATLVIIFEKRQAKLK